MTRLLGFYPAAAAQQYDSLRVAKRIADYQRETSASFRTAWVKASIQNDNAQMTAIEDAVDSWNEATEGTPLQIRNFVANARKALREAERPAGERFLRTLPAGSRDDIDAAYSLLGY